MLLAALEDGLATRRRVSIAILAGDLLWRAVDDDVAVRDQVVKRAERGKIGLAHVRDRLFAGSEERDIELDGGSNPVVGDDIGDAREGHVALQAHRVRDTLSDDAVAVDGDADR